MNTALLSAKALAQRWDTTPGRLANMRCEGTGPEYLKVGSRVLYPLAAIESYEADHIVKPVSA